MNKKIVIIGAGIAGLAAANQLKQQGFSDVVILEGNNRIGGRISTDYSLGFPISLGAQWIHGTKNNPIMEMVKSLSLTWFETNFQCIALYDKNHLHTPRAQGPNLFDNDYMRAAQAYAFSQPQDISLAEAMGQVSQAEEAKLLLQYLSGYTGADAKDLSARYWDQEDMLEGGNQFLVEGYTPIVELLAKNCDIQLNTKVTEVHYESAKVKLTTNQGMIHADKVIVTASLGVLQNSIAFFPALPFAKQESINKLAMGMVDNIILEFPEVFWPKEKFSFYLAFPDLDFRFFVNLFHSNKKSVLVGKIMASDALRYGSYSDQEWAASAMRSLRQVFGKDIPDPTNYFTKRWGADPFALGAYSYITVGASGEDYSVLAEPVADKIYFAGEATHREYPGTVHGAYFSGVREANRIA